jgi:putative peptidoglycan lipid II flippase
MNLLSKVLGFVRETVIAREYGATSLTDAYNAAYTIPYFLQMVLGMALVTSIVPVLTRHFMKGEDAEAWRVSSITLNWTVLAMAVLSLGGMGGARAVVDLITPGFSEATAGLAASLTVIMFPSVVFMSVGMLFTGMLNARKRFAAAAFAPGFSNLVIIAAVLLVGRYGVQYLAWGTLAGMAGAMLIQVPVLRRAGFRYTWNWDTGNQEVRGICLNLLPIFLGTAVNQVYLAINRYFASGLSEGSISALNYAGKLMNLPLGIFVLAVSSAIFPTLSEQAVREDRESLGLTLNRGLKMVLLVTMPAAAGLMALDTPIVRLLFERGAFDSLATRMTAGALFYFSAGMFAMAVNMVLTRAYYALGDVRTPLYTGLLSILVNIIASILLIRPLGHSGLALANTVAAVFSAVSMYLLLKLHLSRLHAGDLLATGVKSLAASLLTGAAALGTYRYLAEAVFIRQEGKTLALAIMAGVAAYAASILALREKEALGLVRKFFSRAGF